MKKIFKLLLILVFVLSTFSCVTTSTPPPTQKPVVIEEPTYNLAFYSDSLIKNLFPKINKAMKPYRHYLTGKEAQELVNEVSDISIQYLKDNKLFVSKKPDVQLFGLSNGKDVAFVLKVQFNFIDKEESREEFLNTVIIVKKFLVFFGQKKSGAGI